MADIINRTNNVEIKTSPDNRKIYGKNLYDPQLIGGKIYLIDKEDNTHLLFSDVSEVDSIDNSGAVAVPGTLTELLDLLITYFYA